MRRNIYAAAALLCLAACASADDADTAATTDAVTQTPAPTPPAATTTGMLDPNSATRDELMTVPGMTAELADAVIAGRPYNDMTAVDAKLASLTEAQRDTVYARVWKPINLNTASDAEILLIPGVGEKMEHEFKEYRPYTTIEQFRREIGKYVDATEVARLEKYVMVPPAQ